MKLDSNLWGNLEYETKAVDDYYTDLDRQELADLLDQAMETKLADRFRNCRKKEILVECKDRCGTAPGNVDRMYIRPETCHARFCEPCCKTFGYSWRRKVRGYIERLARSSQRRRFRHICFEFKNPEIVTSTWIKQSYNIVSKLVKKYMCPRAKKDKRFIGGAIAVLEMSPAGYFHIHCLAYCFWLDQKKISREFLDLSGDSYRVWISDCTQSKEGQEDKFANLTDPEKAVKILNEVTKYLTKPVRSPFIDELFNYIMAIKGRRRIHSWGLFYNNDDIKYEIERSTCPFCGGLLKFLCYRDHNEDSDVLPAYVVKEAIKHNCLPDRYG